MNPSRLFILRPVATTLLMIAVLLVGIIAYRFLPVSALPDVDYPTIQVLTFYPGASPDVMTTSITAPLEYQFGSMPGLDQMVSQSSGGASVVTLRFTLDTELDEAEQEVQEAINGANSLLPTDLPAPPIYQKINPADAPVLTLGVTSRTMKLVDVQDAINTRLIQKLSQVGGVGAVQVSGGKVRAIRVQLNQRALGAPRGWRPTTSARRSPTSTSTRQPAASTGRCSRARCARTARSTTRRCWPTRSSPTSTTRRCAYATSDG